MLVKLVHSTSNRTIRYIFAQKFKSYKYNDIRVLWVYIYTKLTNLTEDDI